MVWSSRVRVKEHSVGVECQETAAPQEKGLDFLSKFLET